MDMQHVQGFHIVVILFLAGILFLMLLPNIFFEIFEMPCEASNMTTIDRHYNYGNPKVECSDHKIYNLTEKCSYDKWGERDRWSCVYVLKGVVVEE